jgi:glutathione S-transferase
MRDQFDSYLKPMAIAAGVIGAGVVARKVLASRSAARDAAERLQRAEERRKGFRPGVVYLFQFPRSQTLLNRSPYCLYTETFMRLHHIPYEIIATGSTHESPSSRVPYVEVDGEVMTESLPIIDRLIQKYKVPGTGCQNDEEHTISYLLIRLLNGAMKLHYVRHLFVDNVHFPLQETIKTGAFTEAEATRMILQSRQDRIAMLNAEGNGDLTDELHHKWFLNDMKAVERVIRDHGTELSSVAACVAFSWLHIYMNIPLSPCPALNYCRNSTVLMAYVLRMEQQCFPDADALLPDRGVPCYKAALA